MRPTKAERAMWDRLASMGCIICSSPASIHTLSRRVWQQKYGTEQELMIKAQERL